MLSKSSKYAIKAVLFLALNSKDNKKVMVKDISGPINVPQAYIAKLLQELSRQNIISSTRGSKGGFYLSDDNRKQSIMSIVDVIDGEKNFNSCMLSLKECDNEKPCPLHNIVYPYRSRLLNRLNEKTIGNLSIEIKSGETFLPL
ncbi:Rrf2 family transcriptional regulator [bacterium AH-315-P13]|nr:Rrf2 family transcriptional regulator [bacterium AH-315-P13]